VKTWGRGGIVPPFLTSSLGGGEWSALLPGHVIPKEMSPGTHCIGDCVGHRTGLDAVEKDLDPDGNRTLVDQPVARR
jgi:hypothetical protein